MKSTSRSLVSAVAATTLVVATLVTTIVASNVAVIGAALGLLAVYGIVELMLHSYRPVPVRARLREITPAQRMSASSVLVAFPSAVVSERAA